MEGHHHINLVCCIILKEDHLTLIGRTIDYGARKRDGIGNRSHDLHRPSTFQF